MGLLGRNVHLYHGDFTDLALDAPPDIIKKMLREERQGRFNIRLICVIYVYIYIQYINIFPLISFIYIRRHFLYSCPGCRSLFVYLPSCIIVEWNCLYNISCILYDVERF